MNLFDLLCSPFIPKRQSVESIDFVNPKTDAPQAPPQLPMMTVLRESPRPAMLVCEVEANVETEAVPNQVSIDEIRTEIKPSPSERFYEKLRYIRDSFTGTAKGSGSASISAKIRACQVAPETTIELPNPNLRIPSHIARNRRRRNAIGSSRQFMESIEQQYNLAPIRETPESAANSTRIVSEVHPINILCDALLQNVENVENYEFHCKNVSENLRAFVPAHNNIVDKIQHVSHYNRIRSQSGGDKSVSCPNFAEVSHVPKVHESKSTVDIAWTPPETHGLSNSQQIIPHYYFRTFERTRGGHDRLIDIDYMFIIKDDIRNMRKLNQYQLDYIYNLGEQEKNEIIAEINNALRTTIDHLCLFTEDPSPPRRQRRHRHRRVGSA